MSESSDEGAEKKDQTQTSEQPTESKSTQPKAPSPRPRIGTPIGTPIGQKPVTSSVAQPSQASSEEPKPATVAPGTPAPAKRPTIGTPVGRPTIGTPAGAARPSVGTPSTAPSTPVGARPPIAPPKPPTESKKDVSRRNFLAGLVVVGGALAIGGVGWLFPFLEGSVGAVAAKKQVLLTAKGTNLLTSDVVTSNGPSGTLSNAEAANGGAWQTFTYPYTGNANIDSDTFKQCVIIRLPPSLTAPDLGFTYAVKDPLMSTYNISGLGDTLVAFSRVCVHLWCLWSYNPTVSAAENEYTRRMQCPCHGSNYVPGTGSYSPPTYNPGFPAATNQPPGQAVAGPASLQVAPNNQLPLIQLSVDPDGTLYATGIIGQIGCGQKC